MIWIKEPNKDAEEDTGSRKTEIDAKAALSTKAFLQGNMITDIKSEQ